jgi:hypothetical protein
MEGERKIDKEKRKGERKLRHIEVVPGSIYLGLIAQMKALKGYWDEKSPFPPELKKKLSPAPEPGEEVQQATPTHSISQTDLWNEVSSSAPTPRRDNQPPLVVEQAGTSLRSPTPPPQSKRPRMRMRNSILYIEVVAATTSSFFA